MNWPAIWIVYKKELLETLRDRRTLIVMVLLPLALYPLLGVGVSEWVGMQTSAREARSSKVALEQPWPELTAWLGADKKLELVEGGDAAAVRAGKLDLLIALGARYRAQLEQGRPVSLGLVHDETKDDSQLALKRVRGSLQRFGESLTSERLAARGVPSALIRPLELSERDVATSRERGSHALSMVLPMLVVLMVLLGAFYPAIDLTAGEKERGTLETLLVAPVERVALIMGKFFVVATIAAVTGLLNLGSLGLTFSLGFRPALQQAGVVADLPWDAIAMTLVALLPASLFFAAVMIAVAALARSFKEAQTLLTPVYLVCVMPAILVQLPGVELNVFTALLPAVNIALLTGDLIGGRFHALPVALALGSSLIYAGAALAVAARIYNSERLLFAQESPWRSKGRRTRPLGDAPQPLQAGALLLLVLVLMLYVGRSLQLRDIVSGLIVTEWLLVAGPVLLLLWWARLSPRAVLSLRPAGLGALLGALLAGLSGWYLVGVLVEGVQQRVLPMPQEMIEQMQKMLFDGERSLALDLFAFAVTPAICEELLFRGVILSASRKALPTASAVALNGVLFGMFHLSVYRFAPTTVLGIVLAVIVVRTGSIYPAMLFHLLNNAVTIYIGRKLGMVEVDQAFPLWWLAVAVAMFVGGLYLVVRSHSPRDGADRTTQGDHDS